MKFLILDFNEDFYPIIERKFEGFLNSEIQFCKTQIKAKELYCNFKPDCIFVSYYLEKTYDSYNFFRKLGFKGDIIILSAGKEKRIKRNYYNGISGILDKFLNKEDFQIKLKSLLFPTIIKERVNNSNILESKAY